MSVVKPAFKGIQTLPFLITGSLFWQIKMFQNSALILDIPLENRLAIWNILSVNILNNHGNQNSPLFTQSPSFPWKSYITPKVIVTIYITITNSSKPP